MTSAPAVPATTLAGGDQMPMVGVGTWKLRGEQARASVIAAPDAGHRHIDTATMYDNEAEIGQALRDSGIDRAELFVTTKIRPADASRARSVLDHSLRALGSGYLELWLIHWPPSRRD